MSVKGIVKIFLYCAYWLSCRLIARKRNRITFISFPDASDNSWHLYRFLVGDLADTEFVWLVADVSCGEKIKALSGGAGNKVVVVRRWSVRGFYLFVSSRLVFYTHGTYFFVGPSSCAPVFVNLWHGMPIKNIGLMDGKSTGDIAYSDYLLASSDFYRGIMAKSFGVDPERVLVCGLPRNDVFLQRPGNGGAIFERMKIPAANKLVVWLPTYRVSVVGDIRRDSISNGFLDELADNFLADLDALAKANNFNVIIKLHPMDSLNGHFHEAGLEHIKIFSGPEWQEAGVDLYDLLAVSDALVSDVSSVIIDYFTSGNSVGIISKALDGYQRGTAFDLEELRGMVTPISEPLDFIGLLDDKSASPESMAARGRLNGKGRGGEGACSSVSHSFCPDLRLDNREYSADV